MRRNFSYFRGQTLVEVMVAMTVGMLVLTAITSSVLTSLVNSRISNSSNEASQIAQEGIEITRLSRTAAAGTYCLDGGVSKISGIPQGTCATANVNGKYIRSVDVFPGTAADCGIDVNKTVVTVKWTDAKCANGSYCHKTVLNSCMNVIALAGTITPTPLPPGTPTVSLLPASAAIDVGGSVTLTWSSTNAVSCTWTAGLADTVSASGSTVVYPTAASTTYTMRCTSSLGVNSSTQSSVVTINPATFTTSFTASPTTVAPGGSTTLNWVVKNATSCTATGGWTGSQATSGPVTKSPINARTTYSLQCTGVGGSSSVQQATVSVQAQMLANTGFESGASQTNWIIQQTDAISPDGPICQESTTYCPDTTPDGAWYLKLGGINATQYDDQIYQTVALPATTTNIVVSFKYRITTAETTTTLANDNFYATVKDVNGSNITNGTIASFSNLDKTAGTTWVQSPTYDITSILTSYSGQTIRFRFVSANNSTLKSNMIIDQVFFTVTY